MQKRCNLISEHMQKISPTILEEALLYVSEDHQQLHGSLPSSINLDDKPNHHLLETEHESETKIGFGAMQRANSTIEDFCRSYFMFHGMDVNNPQTTFRFLPILCFVESYIYQLDTMNEKSLQSSLKEKLSRSESIDPLIHLLQCHGLLTERIKTELQSGVEYWELERKLCHALSGKKKILIDDVMRAIHLKSFDYRVLNLLLYQLTNQQVNDLHMEFLSISEFLVEVSDDLYDYEDDVIENSFNILRIFVGAYGATTAPCVLAKCITDAEEKYGHLSKALDPELSLKYWMRCKEATKEGGTTSSYAFGTWSIPPLIVDEDSFRLQATGRSL